MDEIKAYKATTAEYNSLPSPDPDALYIVSPRADFDPASLGNDAEGDIYIGSTLLTGKNAAPGTLNTNNTQSQQPNTSEPLSGNVNLHKIAKTGLFSDLNNVTFTSAYKGFDTTSNTPAGWRRIATLNRFGSYILYMGGTQSNMSPNVSAVAVSLCYSTAYLRLLWCHRAASITKVRLVRGESNNWYLDVYHVASANRPGTRNFCFIGYGNTISMTTATTFAPLSSEEQEPTGVTIEQLDFYVTTLQNVVQNEVLPWVQPEIDAANKLLPALINGRSGAKKLFGYALVACQGVTNDNLMLMAPLMQSGGATDNKIPNYDAKFPIGCSIYMHPDSADYDSNTDFTSKLFYLAAAQVDARHSAVNGASLNLGKSSTSDVFLRVAVSDGHWSPYYKSGSTTEIIVSSNSLVTGGFYLYLGKTAGDGSPCYTFQLEANHPLYYYDGSKLIDWATYIAELKASALDPEPYLTIYSNGFNLQNNNGYQDLDVQYEYALSLVSNHSSIAGQFLLVGHLTVENRSARKSCVIRATLSARSDANSSAEQIACTMQTIPAGGAESIHLEDVFRKQKDGAMGVWLTITVVDGEDIRVLGRTQTQEASPTYLRIIRLNKDTREIVIDNTSLTTIQQ